MDLKLKMLANRFRNNSFFLDLNEYINTKVKENKLTFETLKYIYLEMYRNHSEFIKLNIYPITEFLVKGYTIEEAENIAKLLPDAFGKDVFCYNEKEKGYKYNKLFGDLLFAYEIYDHNIKRGYDKEKSFLILKQEINETDYGQRYIEEQIFRRKNISKEEVEECYNETINKMDRLRKEFNEITSNDEKLKKYFENSNSKDTYTNILVAGAILGRIELTNLQKENDNLKGNIEEFPYNKKQINMIDRYYRLQKTIDIIDNYMENEMILEEDEMEEEFE